MSIVPSVSEQQNNTSSNNNSKKITTVVRRKSNNNIDQAKSTYEAAYNILKRLNTLTLPQSMNRITTNGNIKIFIAKYNLISEVNPEDNLREEYLTYRYYCISLRGQEYLKRYESFKELIS